MQWVVQTVGLAVVAWSCQVLLDVVLRGMEFGTRCYGYKIEWLKCAIR